LLRSPRGPVRAAVGVEPGHPRPAFILELAVDAGLRRPGAERRRGAGAFVATDVRDQGRADLRRRSIAGGDAAARSPVPNHN
jgi:hypothetical protein